MLVSFTPDMEDSLTSKEPLLHGDMAVTFEKRHVMLYLASVGIESRASD